MSFLQPWLLLGLPLLFLPIIIHLINQWRYQTKRWGAMMFLLAANRMARGYAKIRQYLILAMRMLAILGLIFAISRPLASGLLGLSGGKTDTTIVLLDRSPSMQERGENGIDSKFTTAKRQLRETLQTLGSNRWVLIDSAQQKPQEFQSVADLFDAPSAQPSSASADLPGMLQTAIEYLKNNRPGQTEIWICSDLRQSDWNSNSNQWSAVRDAFRQFPQTVRLQLISYAENSSENVSIRVTDVRRETVDGSQALSLSLMLVRDEKANQTKAFPVQVEVNGARSELPAEMTGSTLEIKNHRVAVDQNQVRGWGKVSIPADANNADNEFYFVFDQPPPRKTIVISEDDAASRPLELSAGISPDPNWKATVDRYSMDQIASVDWDRAGLLLWQGALPSGAPADAIVDYVQRGGYVIFFPPTPLSEADRPSSIGENSNSMFGVRWNDWVQSEKLMIDNWRSDQDLLAATRSGASLPVGQLEIQGYAKVQGDVSTLASVTGGDPLLSRVATDRGGVYFCGASPSPKFSNMARGGVVLYVAIQRALESGMLSLGNTRDLVAGANKALTTEVAWQQVLGPEDVLSTEYPLQGGVYNDGDKLISINRAISEDQTSTVDDTQLYELFQGLSFTKVESIAGKAGSIVREVWRVFLVLMIIAMILEAAMCIPKIARPVGGRS